MVVDAIKEGVVTATHAVIFIIGRVLEFDFGGYDEQTIDIIMEQLDLSVYFKEE